MQDRPLFFVAAEPRLLREPLQEHHRVLLGVAELLWRSYRVDELRDERTHAAGLDDVAPRHATWLDRHGRPGPRGAARAVLYWAWAKYYGRRLRKCKRKLEYDYRCAGTCLGTAWTVTDDT